MKNPLVRFSDIAGERFKGLPFGPLWKLLRGLDTEMMSGYAYADIQDSARTQLLDFTVPLDCYLFCHDIEIEVSYRGDKSFRIDLFADQEQMLPARYAFIGSYGVMGVHVLNPGDRKVSLKMRRVLAPGTVLRIFGTRFQPYQLGYGYTPLTPQGFTPQYDIYNADDPLLGSLGDGVPLIDWSPGLPIPTGWPFPPLEQRIYFKGKGRITLFANLTLSAPDPTVVTSVEVLNPNPPNDSIVPEAVIGTNINPWTSSERTLTVTPGMEIAEFAFRVQGGTGSNLNNLKVSCVFQEAPLDWENSVVINARIRGTRIPRDVFRTFGEL